MSIEMKCSRCGASIATDNVAEAVKWDVSHDEVCSALHPRTTESKEIEQ